MNQPCVGGNGVALLDQDDVARHDLGGIDASPLSVAQDVSVRRSHLAQCGQRGLGSRFLDIAHERIQQHDRGDGQGLVG